MSQQLGPTYLLSVLVVIGSAIAFYRAEKPQAPPPPRVVQEQRAEVRPRETPQPERPATEPSRARLVAETRTPPVRVEPKPKPAALAEPPRARVDAARLRPVPRAPSAKRGAFARAEEGETLGDIALRIYGTAEKAEALWKANRDQLPSQDAALTAGMLLRTP